MSRLIVLNIVLLLVPLALLIIAINDAIKEREKKARNTFIGTALVWCSIACLPVLAGSSDFRILWFLPGFVMLSVIVFIIPGPKPKGYKTPVVQIDERDIAFSRNELREGTRNFKDYYEKNPHLLKTDLYFRSLPGLMSPESLFYDRQIYRQTDQNFHQIDRLHSQVNCPAQKERTLKIPSNHYEALKNIAIEKGAYSFGSTKIKPYHIYSYKGRGDRHGEKLEGEFAYAIAFTIEMDYEAMQHAPKAPVVLESSRQYLHSAEIAIEIAQTISKWGFSARAHIDGNYHVICPLVAKDAGLGEIGRMGILMTPKLGPRVRIAVVTTDLEFPSKNIKDDLSVLDFCQQCKICSESCPAHAIPSNNRTMNKGVDRWQINQEKCFTLWCKTGTDCGICMRKCPYSHPDTLSHRLSRFGIKHSYVYRRGAIWLEKRIYQP